MSRSVDRAGQQPEIEIVELVPESMADCGLIKVARKYENEVRINGRPVGFFNDLKVDLVSKNGDECVAVTLTLYPKRLTVSQEVSS